MSTESLFYQEINTLVKSNLEMVDGIVKSIIELIDPVRTARSHLHELEKTEKTYIGTKVELIIKYYLKLSSGVKLDCKTNSQEFDIKCTVGNNWMIPPEAVGENCLLIKINWDKKEIAIGAFSAVLENLSTSTNQDQKRSVSKYGKTKIQWIVNQSFILPTTRPHIEWK